MLYAFDKATNESIKTHKRFKRNGVFEYGLDKTKCEFSVSLNASSHLYFDFFLVKQQTDRELLNKKTVKKKTTNTCEFIRLKLLCFPRADEVRVWNQNVRVNEKTTTKSI